VPIPNAKPKIELSKLRDIGWEFWDPIGLKEDREDIEDEYDTYLLRAAGMIWHKTPPEDVIAYLLAIEQDYMGMPDRGSDAATITVAKIQSYLKTLEVAAGKRAPVESIALY
tara:strand:+ start:328 stop:663 length:336 start_codon:yes stop_codon:yes gene_type:complete